VTNLGTGPASCPGLQPANLLRILALPDEMESWSLTTIREMVAKISAKLVVHAQYAILQMPEVAVPHDLFRRIIDMIDGFRLREPAPCCDGGRLSGKCRFKWGGAMTCILRAILGFLPTVLAALLLAGAPLELGSRLFQAPAALAQTATCGHYGQNVCRGDCANWVPAFGGGWACDGYNYNCADGTTPSDGSADARCGRNLSGWTQTPLNTRKDGPNCPGQNGWICSDRDRDGLSISRDGLFSVRKVTYDGGPLSDGRYIYILDLNGDIWISAYDEGPAYDHNRSATNWRNGNQPCSPNTPNCEYKHVRHTQLNQGWGAVYCAGELRVVNGRVDRINNGSGHYTPDASCTQNVATVLGWLGDRLAQGYQTGDYHDVVAKEDLPSLKGQCPSTPGLEYTCVIHRGYSTIVCGTDATGVKKNYYSAACACQQGAVRFEADVCVPEPVDSDEADELDHNELRR
jgi:hypothetical protein